jgi:hypothetical protein
MHAPMCRDTITYIGKLLFTQGHYYLHMAMQARKGLGLPSTDYATPQSQQEQEDACMSYEEEDACMHADYATPQSQQLINYAVTLVNSA